MTLRMVRRVSVLILIMLCISGLGFGQFNTPVVDGSIAVGEYGTHNDGQNQETNGSQVWYMTWDDNNLYIAIDVANVLEAAIIYIDTDPQVPVNSGAVSNGALAGQEYDSTNFSNLQFRADFVAFFENGYREYRTDDGSGGWSTNTTGFGSYSDDGGDTREVSIPWSVITGGSRPASFNWFGYVTSSGGSVYGEMPEENPSGFIDTTARWDRYYNVGSTGDASSTNPFSQNCYVFNSTTDITGFGAIDVFDFTMNSSGLSITRAASGAWNIAGQLRIADGTLDFGSVSDDCDVNGNVVIGSTGELILSSQFGADLTIGGDFEVNGTFNCNERAVIFDGNGSLNSQTILGSTNPTIDYFLHNNGNPISLQTDVVVDNEINLSSGSTIILGSSTLSSSTDTSFTITGYGSDNYIVTNGSGVLEQRNIGTTGRQGFVVFPVGDTSRYAPVRLNNNISGTDDFSIRVCEGVYDNGTCSGSQFTNFAVDHTWIVGYTASPNFSIELHWSFTEEMPGFNSGNSVINYYDGGWNGLGTFNAAGTSFELGFSYQDGTFDSSTSPPLSFGVSSGVILPVHWLDVSAVPAGDVARVTWEVEEFNGTAHYWVERSADGIRFDRIQKVAVSGHVGGTKTYSIDDHPGDGNHVYRIAVHDWDGSVQYSPLVSVKLTGDPVRVYPNPTTGHITLALNESATEAVNVDILDAQGRLIAVHQITDQTLTMELAPGFYFVKIEGGGTERVVVMD